MFLTRTHTVQNIQHLPAVCAEMGWEGLRTVQLDAGADLEVRTNFIFNYRYGMIAFHPNKRIYFSGKRNLSYQTFCVVDKDASFKNEHDYIDHGNALSYSAISGLCSGKDFESFQIGPSGKLLVAAIPWTAIKKWTDLIDRFGADTSALLEKACRVNEVLLHPLWYARLCGAMARRTYFPRPDPHGTDLDQLLCMVVQATLSGNEIKVTHPQSIRLTRAIIDLAHQDTELQPAKLTDLAQILHADERTLQLDTKRQVGMGPMELLKLVRMQQVRRVLTDRTAAQQFSDTYELSGVTHIPTVFHHYGLNYNSNSIKRYKDFYGNSPKQDQKTCAG